MSAAPTHRKGSMPKNGGPRRQRVSHHGTKPATVPGARMKNTSDPSEAQKRRMAHPQSSRDTTRRRLGTLSSTEQGITEQDLRPDRSTDHDASGYIPDHLRRFLWAGFVLA